MLLAGLNDISLGAYDSAQERFDEALRLYRRLGDHTGIAMSLIRLGTVSMLLQKYSVAEKWLQDALILCDQTNDQHCRAGALINLGEVCRLQGNSLSAYQHLQAASLIFAELGLPRGVAIAENDMGHLMAASGNPAQARQHYQRAFEIASPDTLIPEMLDTLAGLALLLHQSGQLQLARQISTTVINHPARLDETYQLLEPILSQLNDPSQSIGDQSIEPDAQPPTLQQLFDQAIRASSVPA